MASSTTLRPRLTREEAAGLIVAAAAHAALFAWLSFDPPGKPVLAPAERMTVTLSEAIEPRPTAPEPASVSALSVGQEAESAGQDVDAGSPIPEQAPPPEATPLPTPAPLPPPRVRASPEPPLPAAARPKVSPTAKPPTKPEARPSPKAAASPAPKPAPKAEARAADKSPPRPAAKAAAKAAEKPATKATASASASADGDRSRSGRAAGVSRIGDDFLKGVPGDSVAASSSRAAPADAAGPGALTVGPEVAASLSQAIAQQLKPHWTAPQGVEAERLVTVLAWDLRPDGSLAGRPRVVSQSGITDANRAQKDRHAEQAVRAVQLAAPFRLPERHYSSWRRIAAFRFDRKMSR